MDLDAVADELYGLRPEEFVAARDRRALDARKAGDQALAKEIRALRRPSLAAWVSNLLVRRQREEIEPLLALGDELRRAHRTLDGPRLRKLARRQSEVIGALGRQARLLAAQAGHPVGEGVQREVEETLHAVLADPEAAREWATGRLVKPLTPASGFPEADEDVLDRRPVAPTPTKGTRRAEGRERDGRGTRRKRDGTGEREDDVAQRPPLGEEEPTQRRTPRKDDLAHRRRLREARAAARDAERDLRARETDAGTAEREAEKAGDRVAAAEERVRELRAQLRAAEEEQRRARTDEQAARGRARQAERAVREARREAGAAAARAERPAAAGPPARDAPGRVGRPVTR